MSKADEERARSVVEDFEDKYVMGLTELESEKLTDLILAALAAVRKEEREACIKILFTALPFPHGTQNLLLQQLAQAIRTGNGVKP